MRKKAFIFLFLLVLLFSFNFVSPSSTNGLTISSSVIETIITNQSIKLEVQALNNSDNNLLNNSIYNCTLDLYNSSGYNVLNQNLTNLNTLSESIIISGSNFSTYQTYPYTITCITAVDGDGLLEGQFIVSRTGRNLTTAESLLYPVLTGVIFLLLLISSWLVYALPYYNKEVLETGRIFVNALKYVKLMMILITHALLLWLLNVLIALSDSYISLNMYYSFVSFIFTGLTAIAYPLFIVVAILIGVNIFKDFQAMNLNKIFMRK